MPVPLPERPSLGQLRKQARDLQRAARRRAACGPEHQYSRADDAARAFVESLHPGPVPSPWWTPASTWPRRGRLVVRAAALRSADAVRLVVRLGFDVNGMGRADLPVDQPWETALHVAAGEGDAELVGALLELGADATIRGHRFDATAADWAGHFDHTALAETIRRRPGGC